MGFSLILRAFFSFPNERQFIECQFFWEFRQKGESAMKDVFLIGIELSHHGEERHFYLVFLVTDLSTGRSIVFPVSASPVIGVPNFEPAKLISAVGTFYFEGHPPLSPTRMQSTLGNQPLYPVQNLLL